MATQVEPLTPEWWVDRLYRAIMARRERSAVYDRYYRGNHPVPWLPAGAQDEFARLLDITKSNYMGLVCDAMVERQRVMGFRLVTPDIEGEDDVRADKDLWRIWQANKLNVHYNAGLLEAAINGMFYIQVEPNLKEPEFPFIYIEHPDQMIVEFKPGTNRRERAASLKVFRDDWTGETHATLILEDGAVWKYKTTGGATINISTEDGSDYTSGLLYDGQWTLREVPGEEPGARNALGMVPVWESPNNPRLLTGGRSEIDDLYVIQDRVNKTLADRLITQDYLMYPQRWISGWPQEDAAGATTATAIPIGRNRVVTTDVAEAKFGQWAAADVRGYNEAKREDVKDIASRSRTPAQYLLGEMSNVNGATLQASESGLVSKIHERNEPHGTELSEAMRSVRRLAGLPDLPSGATIEVLWRDPQYRSAGELIDALVKASTIGVPPEALWERWGATPSEIERWRTLQDEAVQRAMAADPTVILADRYRMAAGVQRGTKGEQTEADGEIDAADQGNLDREVRAASGV